MWLFALPINHKLNRAVWMRLSRIDWLLFLCQTFKRIFRQQRCLIPASFPSLTILIDTESTSPETRKYFLRTPSGNAEKTFNSRKRFQGCRFVEFHCRLPKSIPFVCWVKSVVSFDQITCKRIFIGAAVQGYSAKDSSNWRLRKALCKYCRPFCVNDYFVIVQSIWHSSEI